MDFLKWLWNERYSTDTKFTFFGVIYMVAMGISMLAYKPLALVLVGGFVVFCAGLILYGFYCVVTDLYKQYLDHKAWVARHFPEDVE